MRKPWERTRGFLKSGNTPAEEYVRLWNTITSGKEWRGEFCNKKKNGELYWESASISPVDNGAGVTSHFVAIKEDITERKQAEAERALTTQRMESLLALNHMTDRPMEEIVTAAVEEAIRLTGSQIGYLALMNEDESVLTMQYWSKAAMAACAIIEQTDHLPDGKDRPLGRGGTPAANRSSPTTTRPSIRTNMARRRDTCP